jgi:diguanylate cyclase (GGDEF)-like protein
VHQFIDDTNVRELQMEMAYRASHDALTGLANRAVVMEALERWTDDRRGPGDAVGVLYCDLDGLKTINDGYGHAAGDAVLAAVATRMTDAVRGSDLVARLGGDEFVVLMPGIHGVEELTMLAEKLRSIVGESVVFEGSAIATSVSVGGTLVDVSDDADAALARADDALYAAKAAGRNRVNVT